MYYPYFITYMVIGLGISLGVFFWAIKTGQFADQQRARFLPLKGLAQATTTSPKGAGRYEVYALWGLAMTGLILTGLILVKALLH